MKKIMNVIKGNVGLLVIVVALAVFPLYLIASQTAEAQASDCYTNFVFHWHIVNPVLACMEGRLDTGGGGEANTASNLGDGDGVYAQKVGVDLQFKSLENGSGITLSSDANEVTISSSVTPEGTVCTDNGTGLGWCNGGNVNIKSVIAGTGISIADTTDDLTITNTVTDTNSCSSTGTGEPVCESANNINSLIAGTGISITDTAGDLTVTNTAPATNHNLLNASVHPDTNIGDASPGRLIVGVSGNKWDDLIPSTTGSYLRLIGTNIQWSTGNYVEVNTGSYSVNTKDDMIDCNATSGNITLSGPIAGPVGGKVWTVIKSDSTVNTCTIDPAGSDTIGGQTTYVLKTQGEWIQFASIASNANDLFVLGKGPISSAVGEVYVSKTMTNIGTTNVDIYVTAFDEEDMMMIDCTNIKDMRIVYMWDYVGIGTQTIRWVNVADNTNILYTTTRTSDADAIDSGWFAKPSFCTGVITFEQQGSSTTAGDDPIAKGYVIYAR